MKFRRFSAFFLALLLAALCALPVGAVAEGCTQETNVTTILFTHDLHSHFLPQETVDGGESGGYARLATVLQQERSQHPDALTLDGGDFSIGSLIQTLYTSKAPELRTMGALGYDATTAGNHEFDHEGLGFARMLTAARTSGDKVPALLMANYKPADDNPDQLDIQRALSAYGVRDYMLLERGGITYGIFGIMGTDSDDCAPTSGFTLEDKGGGGRDHRLPVPQRHQRQGQQVGGSAAGQEGGRHRPHHLRPHPHYPGGTHRGGGHLYRLCWSLL